MTRLLPLLVFLGLGLLTHAVTVSLQVFPARCGLDNGGVNASPSGGVPPYTYAWSTGNTASYLNGLAAGTYSVTVTDGLGSTAQATGTVMAVWELNTLNNVSVLQPDCNSSCVGMVSIEPSAFMGTAPYSYQVQPTNVMGNLVYDYLCWSVPLQYGVTDANGCPGVISVDLTWPWTNVQTGYPETVNITPACAGASNGSMTVRLMAGDPSAYLHVGNASGVDLSFFPAQGELVTITGLAAGMYGVSAWINGYDGNPMCTTPNPQTIPEIPGPCGDVSGVVFNDSDGDCLQGSQEPGLPFRVLTITPGPTYAITDNVGAYASGLAFGNYALAQPLIDEAQRCPASSPVPFVVDNSTPQVIINLADSSFLPHDLDVHLSATSLRPGFAFTIWGTMRNNTAYASGSVSVQLAYDPLLDPVIASGNGTASAGMATWSIPVVSAFGYSYFSIHGILPADITLLGQVFSFTATVTNTVTELDLANNSTSLLGTVVGSYDPNDKHGTTSSGLGDAQYFLAQDEWIDYTVRFQNTGTAAAETVVIRDVIDTDYDLPSLEILGASHAFTPSFGDGRELVFTFSNINLPDSTTDLLGSQGYVNYRIKPRSDIVLGDVLENTAGIYFDFNPPIITNTTSHVVDFSTTIAEVTTGALRAFPVPAVDELRLISGSPIRSVEVFSIDGRRIPISLPSDGVIDVRALASGSYFLRARLLNGEQPTVRFEKR